MLLGAQLFLLQLQAVLLRGSKGQPKQLRRSLTSLCRPLLLALLQPNSSPANRLLLQPRLVQLLPALPARQLEQLRSPQVQQRKQHRQRPHQLLANRASLIGCSAVTRLREPRKAAAQLV